MDVIQVICLDDETWPFYPFQFDQQRPIEPPQGRTISVRGERRAGEVVWVSYGTGEVGRYYFTQQDVATLRKHLPDFGSDTIDWTKVKVALAAKGFERAHLGELNIRELLSDLAGKSKAAADTKADTREKNRKKLPMPEGAAKDYCNFLKRKLQGREPDHGELRNLAEEFCDDNPRCGATAESLERKARTYSHIWKADT